MGDIPTVEVRPIFGWGWTIGGMPRFEVPKPFRMDVQDMRDRRCTGRVLSDGHEFKGQRVTLSPRHTEWDGAINIEIEPIDPNGRSSVGFGMLDEIDRFPHGGE